MLYHDYIALKRHHGKEMAKKIIRFRLAHLENLLSVAEEEDLMGDSQCRKVEALDVFTDKTLYRQAKKWLHEYKTDLPEESAHYKIYEKPEEIAVRKFSEYAELGHSLVNRTFVSHQTPLAAYRRLEARCTHTVWSPGS